jgi:hypothetical protein
VSAHCIFDNRGVCLAEVMVALAAGAIILSATFQTLHLFDAQLTTQHTLMSHQQDQRLGLHVLTEELRLAGSGAANDLPGVLVADSREIEFLANLDGTRTVLTDSVSAIQSELPVLNGSNWDQGKHILICTAERCAESRLAMDGRRSKLTLTGPVGQTFPAGTEVFISNHLRYYIATTADRKQSLMRQVDGGANTIVGDITYFQLNYFDKRGMPTREARAASRVRVELGVGANRSHLMTEIGLRGQ